MNHECGKTGVYQLVRFISNRAQCSEGLSIEGRIMTEVVKHKPKACYDVSALIDDSV